MHDLLIVFAFAVLTSDTVRHLDRLNHSTEIAVESLYHASSNPCGPAWFQGSARYALVESHWLRNAHLPSISEYLLGQCVCKRTNPKKMMRCEVGILHHLIGNR